jgi:8-oxo-dGTP diphosphatase
MKRYVLGFAFDEAGAQVALIIKARPSWQAGRLNGIGGKVEPGETALQAMVREFREEADVVTEEAEWEFYAHLRGDEFEVCTFRTTLDGLRFAQLRSCTDEPVVAMPVYSEHLGKHALSNVPWLIAAAQDPDCGRIILTVDYGPDAKALARELLAKVVSL